MSTKLRRGQNEGSIYQRKDGRWEAIITIPAGDVGASKRQSFYGPTKKVARDKLNAAQRNIEELRQAKASNQTLGHYLAHWLENTATPRLRPSTIPSYRWLIEKHLTPALGHIQLRDLSAQDIEKVLNEKLAAGVSPRTVQYMRAVLRSALKTAERRRLVTRNEASLTDPPKQVRHEIRALNPGEAQRLLVAAKGERLEALYTVALMCGLRAGELFALRWTDIDFERGTLSVRATLQRIDGRHVLAEPKTAKGRRTLPLPGLVSNALREHRTRQFAERQVAERWDTTWNLVFCSKKGTPLDHRDVLLKFHGIVERAGLPRMRLHDLRHSCATLLLSQGASPRVIMEVLGHSQISLTMNTYSHVLPHMLGESAAMMDRILAVPK
jgi:integrase